MLQSVHQTLLITINNTHLIKFVTDALSYDFEHPNWKSN